MRWLLDRFHQFRYRTVVSHVMCLDESGNEQIVSKSVGTEDRFLNIGRRIVDIVLYLYLVLYFVMMAVWIVR